MKIVAPNSEYTGVSASVPFCNGIGYTDDKNLIRWFKEHGYHVEDEKAQSGKSNKKPASRKNAKPDEKPEEEPDEKPEEEPDESPDKEPGKGK